jgi:hypothetical protein
MDIGRNPHTYTTETNCTLDEFLGTPDWRNQWNGSGNLGALATKLFCERMKAMGFRSGEMIPVHLHQNKGPRLYHLAFFSKNPRGIEFWNETRAGTNNQLDLLFPDGPEFNN